MLPGRSNNFPFHQISWNLLKKEMINMNSIKKLNLCSLTCEGHAPS